MVCNQSICTVQKLLAVIINLARELAQSLELRSKGLRIRLQLGSAYDETASLF